MQPLFGQVWTAEYLVQQAIVEQLCEAACLAASDFSGSRARIRKILDALRAEVEAYDAAAARSAQSISLIIRGSA